MEDTEDIRTFINQAIKIDYRIYQQEQASKVSIKTISVYKALQQVQKLWYSIKPIDLNSTREHQRKQP